MATVLVALCVLVICLYIVHAFVPLDGRIKTLLELALVVIFVVWALTGTSILSRRF